MSTHIQFSGPFIKTYYSNIAGTGNRASGNPASPSTYSQSVPTPLRRIHLFIQNNGGAEVNLTLAAGGPPIKLFTGQSISFDNYNGSFTVSDYTGVTVLEAFA